MLLVDLLKLCQIYSLHCKFFVCIVFNLMSTGMEGYFKRKVCVSIKGQNIDRKKSSSVDVDDQDERDIQIKSDIESNNKNENDIGHESDVVRNERDVQGKIDDAQLPTDRGLRIPIMEYHVNVRNKVQRAYVQIDPCQPSKHKFSRKKYGKSLRYFLEKNVKHEIY